MTTDNEQQQSASGTGQSHPDAGSDNMGSASAVPGVSGGSDDGAHGQTAEVSDAPASTPFKDAADNNEPIHDIKRNDEIHNESTGSNPIKGYRELTTEDTSRINSVKAMENEVGKLVKSLMTQATKDSESVDARLVAVARTDLQKGFMNLVRSIAQPVSEL